MIHIGVLRRLMSEQVRIDAIVGSSVGAIIGALYAAAGMNPDEMVAAARELGPPSLFRFAMARWGLRARPGGSYRTGSILDHLVRLEGMSFENLTNGVSRLGVLTYDLVAREEILLYGGPGRPALSPLSSAVIASASIPALFPPVSLRIGRRRLLLADAGWFSAVPIEHAFSPPVSAHRVIAVDLSLRLCRRQRRRAYWEHLSRACGDRLMVLRPEVSGSGTMVLRPGTVDSLVAAGESSIDDAALATIRSWSRTESPPASVIP